MYVTFSKRGDLDKNSVLAKFAYTATDGKKYNVDCYNLDVIISVGYRVKSHRGTQFRIRDIRSSEKVFWRKVLKIYATSIDYDPHAESSVLFFKQVQNKIHWAAHKHTAAEVIYERADAEKENMGLTVQFADIFVGIVRHRQKAGNLPALNL